MKTFMASPATIERKWYVVDATDKVLGRMATEIASILRGKHKPIFTPHMDTGDYVIVVNAEKIKLTGRKMEQKTYFRHTGYIGHWRQIPVKEVLK
jgi:large subunit ribosomal protein L13